MVRIRLSRTGKRNSPSWKLGAFDKRTRRDGKAIEYLGAYNPHAENPEDKLDIDVERVKHWIDKGAQPSKTVAKLLSYHIDM